MKKNLESLRRRIDKADLKLLKSLSSRFAAVREVGILKRQAGLPILQKKRFQTMLEDRVRRGQQWGLSETFIKSLYRLIHKEAIRIQKKTKGPPR